MKYIFGSLVLFSVLLLSNCNSSNSLRSSQENNKISSTLEDRDNTYVSLTELLRTKQGVMVQGSGKNATIKIRRGASSFMGNSEPLFVLNGQVVSGGYSTLFDMVFVPDIKDIKVLTDASDLTYYGTRAANGVIEINMKN